MPVVRRLLEVLDEFELALMAATDQPDFERFLQGCRARVREARGHV